MEQRLLAAYEVSLIREDLDPEEIFLLGFLKALQGEEFDLKDLNWVENELENF